MRHFYALCLLLGLSSFGNGQNVQLDNHWAAWYGCWTPVVKGDPAPSKTPLVCVVPASGSAAVDVVTVADKKVLTRHRVSATGERTPDTRDNCNGSEMGKWSADGRRVYLHSQYECPGGLKVVSSGLIAMTDDHEWLHVEGISGTNGQGVSVLRYRLMQDPSEIPSDLEASYRGAGLVVSAARATAGARLTLADVIEASGQVETPVVEAWLAERGGSFSKELTAKNLRHLEDAKVPSSTVDLLVALSYPNKFQVNRSARGAIAQSSPSVRSSGGGGGGAYSSAGWGFYGYSPYDVGAFGDLYAFTPYSAYPYSAYNYGWYPGSTPVIVIGGGGGGSNNQAGRLVKGQGYTQTNTGSVSSSSSSSGSSSQSSSQS